MARRESLLLLHQTLLARRAELREKLARELASLNAADSTGDSADLAFESGGEEMSSQLAELDTRELREIEGALTRFQQGMFGICEGDSGKCQKKIPVVRLIALPYASFCIDCERAMEKSFNWQGRRTTGTWKQVFDPQTLMQDQRIDLTKLELALSGNRRLTP